MYTFSDQQHQRIRKLVVAGLLLALGLILSSLDAAHTQGLKLLDWQRQLLGHESNNKERIIIIEVDQYSLDQMQKKQGIGWPWPRDFYGGITRFASIGGAKAILVDILFNNETAYGVSSDIQFAEYNRQAGNVFLAAATSQYSRDTADALLTNISGPAPDTVKRKGLLLPVKELLDTAAGIGGVDGQPDLDGTFRRLSPLHVVNQKALVTLALSPFISKETSLTWQAGSLKFADKTLPLDEEHKLWINYPTNPYYTTYSAYDVIRSLIALQSDQQPVIDPAEFRDAYVLIGYVAPGLYDLKPTPFASRSPGIEIHAAVLDGWLANDFLKPMPKWQSAAIGLIFGLFIYSVFWLQKSVLQAVIVSLSLLSINFLVSFMLINASWIPDIPLLLLPSIMLTAGSGIQRFIIEGREKEFRQKSLERMVSPGVAQWLLEAPEQRMQRTGEMRTITVFFSDLAGFTTMSENLGAEKTVRIINQYMDMMQQVILQHDGTIKQFVGDAVMAIWGAPKEQPEQAALAIKTALLSQQKLDRNQFEFSHDEHIQLQMRIGIDHGDCIVGNIGSSQRFEYAAVGDTVNRASRLEGLNKYYGSRIIVSESAWQASNQQFFGRRLDRVLVKGRKNAVSIYEPLAISGSESLAQRQIADYYERAWKLYSESHWDKAESLLNELLAVTPDEPSRALLQRIHSIKANPQQLPGPDWDGIWQFTSK